MPRFYFHEKTHDRRNSDEDGVELETVEDAQRHALGLLADSIRRIEAVRTSGNHFTVSFETEDADVGSLYGHVTAHVRRPGRLPQISEPPSEAKPDA
ncbi:DUF6894 family protein [Methylobacterium haplocladii]|uniref:DUF6894 family protein n=1 Tax=Methylobacterium haplocladii TaxID=1176176 RepID=UPI001EE12C60|nr:hypothetical protein [Methylobacterium haplocladii]GJD82468.1 hypothetical protein HPGCJGGD_0324 [Methylobacterium haplocladii]GLS61164.1 hypothetical protein GCM10007887_38600 [Methylobacterium haplocladii]